MLTVKEIVQLLRKHSDSEPNPPADAAAIEKLEREFGHPLPEDYKAFLLLHDGWNSFGPEEYDLFNAAGEASTSDRAEASMLFSDQADFDSWVLEVRDSALQLGKQYRMHVLYTPGDGKVIEYAEGEKEAEHDSFTDFLKASLEQMS